MTHHVDLAVVFQRSYQDREHIEKEAGGSAECGHVLGGACSEEVSYDSLGGVKVPSYIRGHNVLGCTTASCHMRIIGRYLVLFHALNATQGRPAAPNLPTTDARPQIPRLQILRSGIWCLSSVIPSGGVHVSGR
jgi:hypothetical protein